jgi:hypothetical protein
VTRERRAFWATAVPELSTWAMTLHGFAGLGFAGLGFAGHRASRNSAPLPVQRWASSNLCRTPLSRGDYLIFLEAKWLDALAALRGLQRRDPAG